MPLASTGAALRNKLSEIDDETDALHARLAVLATERKNTVDALKLIIYPITDLPVELTGEVLRYFVRDGSQIVGSRSSPHSAWVAASVCQTWRNVALATPELWSTWDLRVSEKITKAWVALLSVYIARSQPHSLSVNVERLGPTAATAILPVLAEHASRLQNMTLGFGINGSDAFERPTGQFTRLQTLRITVKEGPRGGDPAPMAAFATAPLLRVVRIESGAALALPTSLELPWAQLTTLALHSVDPNRCLSVLQQTSALEVLEMTTVTGSLAFDSAITSINRLHTLKVKLETPSDAAEQGFWNFRMPLLDFLVLPSLQNLYITGGCVRLMTKSLVKLISASECSITHLSLNEIDASDGLDNLLEATPSLRSLHVSEAGVLKWDNESHVVATRNLLEDLLCLFSESGLSALKHIRLISLSEDYPISPLKELLCGIVEAGDASSVESFEYSNNLSVDYARCSAGLVGTHWTRAVEQMEAAAANAASKFAVKITSIGDNGSKPSGTLNAPRILYCLDDESN
ncbi:C3H1-type domain-containing protein [Mycena kentingensis (nom. inval.)]|nr:C3H1-type domain-containing protein [Mycena kentingensis (nom. inval.)]